MKTRKYGAVFLAMVLAFTLLLPGMPARADASGIGWALTEPAGELTITSNTGMANWIIASTPINRAAVTSVVIEDGVTTIGDNAFQDCVLLASVTIPDSVTTIGSDAFQGCTTLASVTIGDGVTTIGDNAFRNCFSLASVTIPDSVTAIGSFAFAYCSDLASVTIGDSVTTIGSFAFASCSDLASVTIPDSVTTIGSYAFDSCLSLASVTIPGSVTTIAGGAFDSCFSLASVTFLGDTPPGFGLAVFSGIISPITVTVPYGKTSAYQFILSLLPSGSTIEEAEPIPDDPDDPVKPVTSDTPTENRVRRTSGDDGWVTGERDVKTGIDYTADPPAVNPGWLERKEAGDLAGEAKTARKNYVRTRNTGTYGVRGNAWAELTGLRYENDTALNGVVEVRFYTENPDSFSNDTLVSGRITGPDADWVKNHFEKFFRNKIRAIHLDQKEDFRYPAQIAAGIDLAGMNPDNLVFYSYDKESNTYRRIRNPDYWVDSNGYLHFTTRFAGDIIISDGPLEKK